MIFLNKPGQNRNSDGYIRSHYYLYDKFTTDRAAGAVIGSAVDGVGGVREGVDTNSKISIASGVLSFATGKAVNDGVRYPSQSRLSGLCLLTEFVLTVNSVEFGWDTAAAGAVADAIRFGGANSMQVNVQGTNITVGTWQAGVTYQLMVRMRAAGMQYFIKGGLFTNWTLLYSSITGTGAGIPSLIDTFGTAVCTFDNIRAPKQTYIPVPLQSDGMSNSLTDGLGNPENNGIVGTAYEDFGTWGVSGGVRSCSVLGGATGSSVLSTTTKNVHIEVNVTRSSGFAGISARRADSSNYIRCTHDGTNVVVTQVIAGTPTVLSTTAVTYSAGATLKFDLLGTAYRAYYNNTAGGTGTVTDTESTKHGLITSGTANTFDNLVIWGKTGYEGLNAL